MKETAKQQKLLLSRKQNQEMRILISLSYEIQA
jgi:hypothetical protein